MQAAALALRHSPSLPEPPAWGCAQLPGYECNIQPIFDRHCTSCHGEKEPKGGLDFTGRLVGDYAQSYRTLFGLKPSDPLPVVSEDGWRWLHPGEPTPPVNKEFFKRIEKNAAPGQLVCISDRFGGAEVTPVMAFGSARSKLVTTLLQDKTHRDEVKMSRQDWVALVTWVDLNAPYFDAYADKEPTNDNKPARWVRVRFPDPWQGPPAGEWFWDTDQATVVLRP